MQIFEIPYYESLEHIVDTLKDRKNILAVASHGLHCLSLLSKGTEQLTAVDTSPEQVALNYLYKSSVKNFSQEEFIDTYVTPGSREKRKQAIEDRWRTISNDIPDRYHKDISEILNNTAEYGSSTLIRYSEENVSTFFPFAGSDNQYKNLKQKICSGNFNIIQESIISALSYSKDLDGIYFSNVFEWLTEESEDIQENAAKTCSSALKENGIAYISEIKLHPENKMQNMFFGQDMSIFRSIADSEDWNDHFDIEIKPQKTKLSHYNASIATKTNL